MYYACYKHTWEIIDKKTTSFTKIMYNIVHVCVIQWSM